MAKKTIKDDWVKIANIIKARFKRITDENIESMEENIDSLSDSLQSVYGYTKEKADREFDKFKATLHAATKPEKKLSSKKVIYPIDEQRM